jgi:TolB-like protein
MIAVLPLRDTAADESQRFLVDGMTEALVAELVVSMPCGSLP